MRDKAHGMIKVRKERKRSKKREYKLRREGKVMIVRRQERYKKRRESYGLTERGGEEEPR